MNIRRLTPADREAFMALSADIVKALNNKELLIPMTEEEADATFAEGSDDIALGIFEDDRLVATLCLLHDISDYSELLPAEYLCKKGAEVGEAMVLPSYRRMGLMNQLGVELMKYINNGHYNFILATAHPENKASNSWLNTNNFHLNCVFKRREYIRNMYILDIHNLK